MKRMKRIIKKFNYMVFDAAVGPVILLIYSIPLLVVAVLIIILIFITVKLIKKARKKNIEAEKEDNSLTAERNSEDE